ncbi:MAG: NADH-quinone oxidoreductase subunit F [Deltaproteobacteria bacterium]|nr:NADH-quinone oxidoreductase subunit F [Deltaproteobacteria bacterium]
MSGGWRATVGAGSCGLAAGAAATRRALQKSAQGLGIDLQVATTGCIGLCAREVLVELRDPDQTTWLYGEIAAERVPELLQRHVQKGEPWIERLLLRDGIPVHDNDFWDLQTRRILARCGAIDPESLEHYKQHGGYAGLQKALARPPEELVAAVALAGLRGRGGAGYPTANKWRACRETASDLRYVVCNADEGDPGAFMDRNLLEGDPHAVLEGLILAAYAVGAELGLVYVRDEYPLAAKRMQCAIDAARQAGILGEHARGPGQGFDVELRRGAGAFVCGEETALIAAIEGERGIPQRRPPFPTERGLWEKPTSINNVETYANVSWIAAHGAAAFRSQGTAASPGTKIFSLAGDVARGGLVEVGMGTSIAQVLQDIGGGGRGGRKLKAVQIGGPSGGCLPASRFGTPIDFEALPGEGAIMGSGGLVALDDTACMVDVARYFVGFLRDESCGRCSACRVGTLRMYEILTRICSGGGVLSDLDELQRLAQSVGDLSACGLGRSAPNPVLSTLRWFRDEYLAHILEHRCPAGRCRTLTQFVIDPYLCDGCQRCYRQCGYGAIALLGRGVAMQIAGDVCGSCGGCRDVCGFGAVRVV